MKEKRRREEGRKNQGEFAKTRRQEERQTRKKKN
jgi:hypothetical protein